MSFEGQDELLNLLEDIGKLKRPSSNKIKNVVEFTLKNHKVN